MGKEKCSNCIYWVHRECMVTQEKKNDGICKCGQFKPRSENK